MSTFRGIQKKKSIYKDTKRRGKRVRVNIQSNEFDYSGREKRE